MVENSPDHVPALQDSPNQLPPTLQAIITNTLENLSASLPLIATEVESLIEPTQIAEDTGQASQEQEQEQEQEGSEAKLKKRNQKLAVKIAQQAFQVKRLQEELQKVQNQYRREVQTLARSQARMKTLLQHSPDWIAIVGADWRFQNNSLALRRILGYKPEEIAGQHFAELLHPDDLSVMSPYLIELVKQPGVAGPVEFRMKKASGDWAKIEAIANSLLYDSCINGIILNLRDISKRQREAKLPETHQWLEALVQASPLAIVCTDTSALVTVWNPASENLFGWKEPEILGSILPIVPIEENLNFYDMFSSVLEGEVSLGLEWRCLKKDNSFVNLCVWIGPLRDASGNIVGAVHIFLEMPFWVRYIRFSNKPISPQNQKT